MPESPTTLLAIDLGAASGRLIAAQLAGGRFALREVHRFPNDPVRILGDLHWDAPRLWHEINTGLARFAAANPDPPAGIGVDTWGVDFALLDRAGRLLGNPHHYRDGRTDGIPEAIDRLVPPEQVFATTGIQRIAINTLYQFASLRLRDDPQLAAAAALLLMPDLLSYWLTGQRAAELTIASTTQFLDARSRTWAVGLLAALDLPAHILPPLIEPGSIIGPLLPEVRDAAGLRGEVPVIAVASHDTASAVAAIPDLDAASAYISSGTWSLVGVETAEPYLGPDALALNVTNEGGVGGTYRVLKNVAGLWLVQECQRSWRRAGRDWSWPELVALAEAAPPLRSLVDPDAPDFLAPPDMPEAIRTYCRRVGQPEPDGPGALVRCCLDSLALKYRLVVDGLAALTGRTIDTVRVVGGGSQNALLCQLTADACGRRVVAGPVEATALGNALVQALALGHLPDLAAGRAAVAASFPRATYVPGDPRPWDAALDRFAALVAAAP